MAKQSSLSNRKRRLVQKAVPAAPRREAVTVKPAAPAEPKGMAARVAIIDQAAAADQQRIADALRDDAVGSQGPLDPRKAVAAEFGVDVVAGQVRLRSRDGLESLYRNKSLTMQQAKAGLAFRLCYEAAAKGLKSGLGNAGEGGGGRKIVGTIALERLADAQAKGVAGLHAVQRSAAELHQSYILARLNQMERAVGEAMVDGRELHALRMVAGERRTVREIAGQGGHAKAAYRDALARALDAIATALRITAH